MGSVPRGQLGPAGGATQMKVEGPLLRELIDVAGGTESRQEACCCLPLPVQADHVAPSQICVVDAAQVDGDPFARLHGLDGHLMALQASYPGVSPIGIDDHALIDSETSVEKGSRHHSSGAGRRENAVDPHTGPAQVERNDVGGQFVEVVQHSVDALPCFV